MNIKHLDITRHPIHTSEKKNLIFGTSEFTQTILYHPHSKKDKTQYGKALAVESPGHCELLHIEVFPKWRKLKLGHMILEAIKKNNILISTGADTPESEKWLLSEGFKYGDTIQGNKILMWRKVEKPIKETTNAKSTT